MDFITLVPLQPEDLILPGYENNRPQVYLDVMDEDHQIVDDFMQSYDFSNIPDADPNAKVENLDVIESVGDLVNHMDYLETNGFPNIPDKSITFDMNGLDISQNGEKKTKHSEDARRVSMQLRVAEVKGMSDIPVAQWPSLVKSKGKGTRDNVKVNKKTQYKEEADQRLCNCLTGFQNMENIIGRENGHFHCDFPGCKMTTVQFSSIVRHDATIHNKVRPGLDVFKCHRCGYIVLQNSEYGRHIGTHLRADVPEDQQQFFISELKQMAEQGSKDALKSLGGHPTSGRKSTPVRKNQQVIIPPVEPQYEKTIYVGVFRLDETGFFCDREVSNEIPTPLINVSGMYLCDKCDFATAADDEMKKHYIASHQRSLTGILYMCKLCDFNCHTRKKFKKHCSSDVHKAAVLDIVSRLESEGKEAPVFDVDKTKVPGKIMKKKIVNSTADVLAITSAEDIPKKSKKVLYKNALNSSAPSTSNIDKPPGKKRGRPPKNKTPATDGSRICKVTPTSELKAAASFKRTAKVLQVAKKHTGRARPVYVAKKSTTQTNKPSTIVTPSGTFEHCLPETPGVPMSVSTPPMLSYGPAVAQNAPEMHNQGFGEISAKGSSGGAVVRRVYAVAKKSTTNRLNKPPSKKVAKKSTTGRLMKRKAEDENGAENKKPCFECLEEPSDYLMDSFNPVIESVCSVPPVAIGSVRSLRRDGDSEPASEAALSTASLWKEAGSRGDIHACDCGEMFLDEKQYETHKLIHSPDDLLVCGTCGHKAPDKYSMYGHIASHEK